MAHAPLAMSGVSVDEGPQMQSSAALQPIPRALGAPRSDMLLRVASDERLVAHVRDGSDMAFEVIYDRHHRGILGFCRHMLGSVGGGRGRAPARVHGGLPRPDALRQADPAAAVAVRDRAQPLLHGPENPPRAPARPRRRADDREPLERRPAPPGPARRARRRLRAARRAARRARAGGARRLLPRGDRHRARRAAGQGQGARVPGPQLADRQPHGARDPVRGDPRAARDPARRLAAAHHAAPPPARVSRLPRVSQRRSRPSTARSRPRSRSSRQPGSSTPRSSPASAPASTTVAAGPAARLGADVRAATNAQGRRARRPRALVPQLQRPRRAPPRAAPAAAAARARARAHPPADRSRPGRGLGHRARRAAHRRGARDRPRRAVGALAARGRPRAPVRRPRPHAAGALARVRRRRAPRRRHPRLAGRARPARLRARRVRGAPVLPRAGPPQGGRARPQACATAARPTSR